MQSAKIIDVTRSFIPIDPNAYPENLHGTEKEDTPEKRFPVIPYKGFNFLPTAHGYKSFFGTNSYLGIDSLSPNKADRLFLFHTKDYRNILIALCDTGIWFKSATAEGAWTHAITLDAPTDGTYYEWTFAIIKNKLYAFRNNGVAYYLIEDDPVLPSVAGITITDVVPSFITITAQLGMFRQGARLGFWDAENAIATSSPDDYTDFTPSVLTGANVTTYNSVLGRISAIRPHGQHAVVYATKSVVLLGVGASEVFNVKASPILDATGCAYMRQSVEASPNTTHYAYTDTGIWRIESGKAELIVPEVYDYLKPYTTYPIYLHLLQGRFLCFEILDANALNGTAQFSKTVIPPTSLVFQAERSLAELHASDPALADPCEIITGLADGKYTEQRDAANSKVPASMRKPGTGVDLEWICYLSEGNGPDPEFLWGDTPCGATKVDGTGKFKPAPLGDNSTIDKLGMDSANKTARTGADVWLSGGWTMERFVAHQTAVWKAQEKNITAFFTKLLSHTDGASLTTPNTNVCVVNNGSVGECTIGRFPKKFSEPKFGFNFCSFWLTRFATEVSDIKNQVLTTQSCTNLNDPIVSDGYNFSILGSIYPGIYSSPQAALDAITGGIYDNQTWVPPTGTQNMTLGGSQGWSPYGTGDGSGVGVWKHFTAPTGKNVTFISEGAYPTPVVAGAVYPSGYFDRREGQVSSNIEEPVVMVPIPETAYCVLSGYNYTDTNGNAAFMPADGCSTTSDSYPGAAPSADRTVPYGDARVNPLNTADGSICNLPYMSEDLVDPVLWTDQTVTYPGISFLLQEGSIAPAFPTKVGAFVYDLHLKKWGKMQLDYKQLLDYSPINSTSNSPINFNVFGILAGVLKADGLIYLFDDNPASSEITWGKIGYYRLGMTDFQEIRIDFKSRSTGTIRTEVSMDGQTLGTELTETWVHGAALQAIVYPSYSGRWLNLTVTGKFDISYIENRGLHKGRR